MLSGRVTKVFQEKGFGFIDGEDGNVFFHFTSVKTGDFKSLRPGQPVEYECERAEKGLKATTVRSVSNGERPPQRSRSRNR